jgi:flagellar protein FlaG
MPAAPAERVFLGEETMSPIKPISFPVGEMDIPDPRSIHSDPGPKVSSVEGQKNFEGISRAIQEGVGGENIRLNYSFNKPTGQVVVTVLDGKSGKVIREIPPQELLALAESMMEFEGIIFDKKI